MDKKTALLVISALLIGSVATYMLMGPSWGFAPLGSLFESQALSFSDPVDIEAAYNDLLSLNCSIYKGSMSGAKQVDSYNGFLSMVRGKTVLMKTGVEWYLGGSEGLEVRPIINPFSSSCPGDIGSLFGIFTIQIGRNYVNGTFLIDGSYVGDLSPVKDYNVRPSKITAYAYTFNTREYSVGIHTIKTIAIDNDGKEVSKTIRCDFAPDPTSDFYIRGEESFGTNEYFKTDAFVRESVWIYGIEDGIVWSNSWDGYTTDAKVGVEQTIRDAVTLSSLPK